MSATAYASLSLVNLNAALHAEALRLKINDLVTEIAPTRGLRVVREGNAAQGVILSRHAAIGVLICVQVVNDPAAFWKEVLS